MHNNYIDYFYESVDPAVRKYVSTSKELRFGDEEFWKIAVEACVTLFHQRDYLVPSIGKHFSRKHVTSLISEFDLIADVANASKHGAPNRNERLIQDVKSIRQGETHSRFKDDNGIYQHRAPTIFIVPLKGAYFDLLKPVLEVYNFWVKLFIGKGHLTDDWYIRYEGDNFLSRNEVRFSEVLFHPRPPHIWERVTTLVVRDYDNEKKQFSEEGQSTFTNEDIKSIKPTFVLPIESPHKKK